MKHGSSSDCPHCARQARSTFDAEKAYRELSRKYVALADNVARYMADAPLERAKRNANAKAIARRIERIVGGTPTAPQAYPECCLIGTTSSNGLQSWFCTGVLVHPRIVLTAAHCQNPQSSVKVVALNATRQTDLSGAELARVKRVAVHPEYPNTLGHDLAVLVLREPARTAPAPIATGDEIANAPASLLVGFGNDDVMSTGGFGIQREVEVEITSVRRSPNDDLDEAEARFGFESDFEFVAGDPGEDTCNGDSGGPAYVIVGGKRKVAGLTSRATDTAINPCGDGGIYTRVDKNLEFIKRVAEANHIPL